MIPTFIITIWLLGLLSVGLLLGALGLGHEWYQLSWTWDEQMRRSVFDPDFGGNMATAYLAGALALGTIAFFGRPLVHLFYILRGRNGASSDNIPPTRERTITSADESQLHVCEYGSPDQPTMILTHGWGLSEKEWLHAKRELSLHYRLITWDEPGLGRSKPPVSKDYDLENLAADLGTVIQHAGGGPIYLAGHGIGGMIILTYCRLHLADLPQRLAGLALIHTTYTNPVRTVKGAKVLTALETPLLKPLCYLTIGLSPLVRLLNFLAYQNGSAHVVARQGGFAGRETWQEVDLTARLQATASPAVLARGMLGMMQYDATEILPSLPVPVLVIAGDQDTTCCPSASERMAAEIPSARLVTLSPAKHMGLMEHHELVAEALQRLPQASDTPQASRLTKL